MSRVLHHLAALGWGWVATFAIVDLIAVACAVLAVRGRTRRRAFWALLASGIATQTSVAITSAAVMAGFSTTEPASAQSDGSARAAQLATGLSGVMNGTAVGLLSTLVASAATIVCLAAMIVFWWNRNVADTSSRT